MRIYVNGRNIEITDAIKAYAKEKLGKVASHYDQITGIDVVLTVIKNPSVTEKHTAEVICKFTTGQQVQVAETAETMYASIDLVSDKLARQVQKYKEKNLKSKTHSDSIRKEGAPTHNAEEEENITVDAE